MMGATAAGCCCQWMLCICWMLLLWVPTADEWIRPDKNTRREEDQRSLIIFYHARSKEQSEKSFKVFLRRTIGMEWKVECSGMADSKYWNGMALQTAYGWMDLYAMPGSICIVGRYTRADS